MIVNKLIKILLPVVLFCCMFSCKKTSTNAVPIIDDGKEYEISNDIFPNPERGFIRTMIVHSNGLALDPAQLRTFHNQNISLILRFFYLEAFKTVLIPSFQ